MIDSVAIRDRHCPKDGRVSTIICGTCQTPFQRRFIWGTMPKYCSDDCRKEVLRQQKNAFKNVLKNCVVCKKEFFTDKWKAKTRKYCSSKCASVKNGKGGSVELSCTTCGKQIRRLPSNVRKTNFCDYKCMAKGKMLDAPRTNGFANVRTWFGRFNRMSKCEACGYNTIPGILILHHKDRDRKNNHLSNLAVLCPNCHAVEHLAENKKNWKGHLSTNPVKVAARERNAIKNRPRPEERISQ